MNTVHSDVLKYIFRFLSEKDIVIARFVCLRWKMCLPQTNKRVYADDYVRHTELTKWVYRRGIHIVNLVYRVARIGNRDLITWLRDQNYVPLIYCADNLYHGITHSNDVKMLEWAVDQGYPVWDGIFHEAVLCGCLDILKWCKQRGMYTQYNGYCTSAAEHGHFDVLVWLHQNGYAWSYSTCAAAAYYGHLEILQWLHANGCPWDESTCNAATDAHNFEIVQWARENGCPWNRRYCTVHGNDQISNWAQQHRY